jgi:hypothetical protein
MSFKTILGQPEIGRIWMPEQQVSYRTPGKTKAKHVGIVVASIRRPLWSIQRLLDLPDIKHPKPGEFLAQLNPFRGLLDPALFAQQLIWASITHNERVDRGASIQHHRIFGTVGQANNGVFTALAVGGVGAAPTLSGNITKTKTDLSLGAAGSGVTTNEHTTIGLSRAAGTHQNLGAAPGALDGTQASDVFKSFAVTGTGAAIAAGLFDQVAVASSNLYVEDNFSTVANVVNGDTLQITWTITF